MKQDLFIFRSGIVAGLCISIGCVVNLRVGGVAGAVLFAFGLLAVVHYRLKLYTGTAGFIRAYGDWRMLFIVLLGNIVGCGLTSVACTYALPDIVPPDVLIVESRLCKGSFGCFLLAIGCGFIMTTAVEFGREGRYLPLLFGVPVFILCGFTHSVADAFYFLSVPELYSFDLLLLYFCEVVGNFVGCNLYRCLLYPDAQ